MSRVQRAVNAVAETWPVKYLGDKVHSKDSVLAAFLDFWMQGGKLNVILPPTLMGVWGNASPETLAYLFKFFKENNLLPYAPALNIFVVSAFFTSIELGGRAFTGNLEKPDNLVHFPLGSATRRRDAALFIMFALVLQTMNGVSAQYDRKDGLYGVVSGMYSDPVGASVLQYIIVSFLAAVTNAAYVVGKEVYRRATGTPRPEKNNGNILEQFLKLSDKDAMQFVREIIEQRKKTPDILPQFSKLTDEQLMQLAQQCLQQRDLLTAMLNQQKQSGSRIEELPDDRSEAPAITAINHVGGDDVQQEKSERCARIAGFASSLFARVSAYAGRGGQEQEPLIPRGPGKA